MPNFIKVTKQIVFMLLPTACFGFGSVNAQLFPVHISANEPCNVRISNDSGTFFHPSTAFTWKFNGKEYPGFPSSGSVDLELPNGNYHYELDRGPEYYLTRGNFSVVNKEVFQTAELKRMINMKEKYWWAGELHVHRDTGDIEFLMRSSDINIAPVITSWNENFPFQKKECASDLCIKKFDNSRFASFTGSEDERSGGAILVLSTTAPVNFSNAAGSEYPPLAASVMRVRKRYKDTAWIDIEKTFWMDVPVLLATGEINSIGIAHNHMNEDGVFDNEAWGKARDKNKYPSPQGNGLWTQYIYYQILNTGLRIPPSAGSASGVLLNGVGYNRMYAFVKGKLSYNSWFESVKAGRVFVTNGPMLICKANGKLPGEIFRSKKEIAIKINASLYSRDSVEAIQIVKNGEIIKSFSPGEVRENTIATEIKFEKSGWFLVRVICKNPCNFRFASTAPFYVEIGNDKKYISKGSAQFFLDWLDERSRRIAVEDPKQKMEVTKYLEAAKLFWQTIILNATEE